MSFLFITMLVSSLEVRTSSAQPDPFHNFDLQTQSLIAQAQRIVFLVPFSHWDTDWHDTFDTYSRLADDNILKAIQLAKKHPRFRYSLEQVLFVQHFWDTHPEYHDDLRALIRNRQISFVWAGITQPETSLVAPMVQLHNYQLGRDWIAATFGAESVPTSAWQSDAFGNSAAFPTFLNEIGVSNLFIGRGKSRCAPDDSTCKTLPPAFYWTNPSATAKTAGRVLTSYIPYDYIWADIYHRTDPVEQLQRLRKSVEAEFDKTPSHAITLPVGFDFADPQENLLTLVDQWNAADQQTVLVLADADSAFKYMVTQPLPELTLDINPVWQAFYNTRPFAKIADKETEYYLTTANKFAALFGNSTPPDWMDASINAHYDNIAGVSFDAVWNSSQRPRYEATIAKAQNVLTSTLAPIMARIPKPVVIFNPSSWARSAILEVDANQVDSSLLPQPIQRIGLHSIAFRMDQVPALGYVAFDGGQTSVSHPTHVDRNGNHVTITNGLTSVTVDSEHGGTFSSMTVISGTGASQELLTGYGDEVMYYEDTGDVYGAFFGQVKERESEVTAQVTVVTDGPLLARVEIRFSLGSREVVKTITLRADDSLIEVAVDLEALPNTTAIVQTPTNLATSLRTDDLGFGSFTHPVDTRPIVSGDITYRRAIFYPILYWSDVSNANGGLSVITHGLQGMAGGAVRSFMLVRQVTEDPEGVTDPGIHHLQYAYLPHAGTVDSANPWLNAYSFNQPLIVGWRSGDQVTIQLPFDRLPPRHVQISAFTPTLPTTRSLLSAENAIIADLYSLDGQLQAVVINYQANDPSIIQWGGRKISTPSKPLTRLSLAP